MKNRIELPEGFIAGPWIVEYAATMGETEPSSTPAAISADNGMLILCSFDYEHEAEVATANLIAAAPDLYEALKNLENDAGTIPPRLWKMCQDALAKARGEVITIASLPIRNR